ncbi:putative nucleoside-diphosphate-sugar epimerase [Amylocarpus encephaloides]|uniref:Nucleoside-diphosphate-sugar epimerase n=1 Tax=Amylocarpus encephaloides TaxID=45428 RepID=A0A9P8C6I6_9HELO|nr:putative nucleoside-diphosphate-sugar epimerase [Amylocarpus encephaloides]
MKLIIAGSTGFVATEIIRQAISNPAVTSIIALSRRETTPPPNAGADASKLKSVVCNDFSNYSEDVKKELAGADACIWTIAVGISKVKTMPFEEVRKICLDYTVTGLETICPLGSKPFRFLYISGSNTTRDQTKKPLFMPDYSLVRGEVENRVLAYAKESNGAVVSCLAKPGLIKRPGQTAISGGIFPAIARAVLGVPSVELIHISATLIDQAVNGIEKDALLCDDMTRIGSKAFANLKPSS